MTQNIIEAFGCVLAAKPATNHPHACAPTFNPIDTPYTRRRDALTVPATPSASAAAIWPGDAVPSSSLGSRAAWQSPRS